MHVARADPHQPDLGVGDACIQFFTRRQLILGNLVCPAFDVHGGELPFVLGLEVRAALLFVDSIAAPGKFLFAIAAFREGHAYLRIGLILPAGFSTTGNGCTPRFSSRRPNSLRNSHNTGSYNLSTTLS